MTYDELLSIVPSWIGFRDSAEVGFYHNMNAICVFWLMFEHANPEESA